MKKPIKIKPDDPMFTAMTPIHCKGYKNIKGKLELAPGHKKIRLVKRADVHQVTRCESCQIMHRKVCAAISRRKKTEERALVRKKQRYDDAVALKKKKSIWDALVSEQRALVNQIIKEGI